MNAWTEHYARTRATDPTIAAAVAEALALEPFEVLLNVGAGAGSYEPTSNYVVAVEPDAAMRAQRKFEGDLVLDAVAESLPFPDKAFDKSMAILTLHHWQDPKAGFRQLERVTRKRIVVLTFVPDVGESFWLTDRYFPQTGQDDDSRFQSVAALMRISSWALHSVTPVPISNTCGDGVLEAYWARPQSYLSKTVRQNMSSFWLADHGELEEGLRRLQSDLLDGTWNAEVGATLGRRRFIDFGYRVLTFVPSS